MPEGLLSAQVAPLLECDEGGAGDGGDDDGGGDGGDGGDGIGGPAGPEQVPQAAMQRFFTLGYDEQRSPYGPDLALLQGM